MFSPVFWLSQLGHHSRLPTILSEAEMKKIVYIVDKFSSKLNIYQ